MWVYCFFPALQNALTGLAECYQSGEFRIIEQKATKSIHDRNSSIIDGKAYKLQVNETKVKTIMKKYGGYST
jgi:hypothetical protein